MSEYFEKEKMLGIEKNMDIDNLRKGKLQQNFKYKDVWFSTAYLQNKKIYGDPENKF